jgi:putative ABC transport system substrate-binding protein
MMVNPTFPDTAIEVQDAQRAASAYGPQLRTVKAGTVAEIDSAFALIREQGADALIVASDPFFVTQREQLVALAARHGIPSIYPFRESVAAGGLMEPHTGSSLSQGEKPADLPVVQPTTFEMVINLKTAKALGLDVPASLLVR